MSSFDAQDLFSSGPHRFHIGGLSLRHVLHETPRSRGVQLSSQGVHGRAITQTGDLLADDPTQMRNLTDAIESKLDGHSHELIDVTGRSWPNTVMISFDPQPLARVGTRWRTPYRINYLQATP